jgi:hypothetical protein
MIAAALDLADQLEELPPIFERAEDGRSVNPKDLEEFHVIN